MKMKEERSVRELDYEAGERKLRKDEVRAWEKNGVSKER